MNETFKNEVMGEAPPPCETCGGTRVVPTDEEDGEGHTMRGVGSNRCPDCKIMRDDDDPRDR